MIQSNAQARVCVVGAGIIGCTTAYALSQAGYKVHLIDADKGAGLGTSYANGAQLSYSYVQPLASPATLRALPSFFLAKDSAMRFTPRMDLNQWRWITHFLAACTHERMQNGTRELLALAQASRLKLADWQARESLSFHYQQNGKLVLCPSADSLTGQAEQVKFQAALGARQEVLTPNQCVEIEPALAAYADSFAGGVWTESECVGDSYALCQELIRCVVRDGGTVQFNAKMTELVQKDNAIQAVKLSTGEEIQADHFVITTGVKTPQFAQQLGIHTPIYPIKGYSISLPIRDAERAPKVSVTDLSRKTVFAPLNGQLRVAAKAELVGYEMDIPKQRVESMLNAVESLFPGACDTVVETPWTGLRPATPDSLPLIGRTKMMNAYVNAGHGALGFTLACGSAERIVNLMGNGSNRQH